MRQTVAKAFGIPLGQEFDWDSLTELACEAVSAGLPCRITVLSLVYLGVVMPEEAEMVGRLLRQLRERYPEIGISVALNR